MSSLDLSSSSSNSSENSDVSDFKLEVEHEEDNNTEGMTSNHDITLNMPGPYSEEPIASESWIQDYENKKKETLELKKELTKRLNGETTTSEWCKCENCDVSTLQNISESYCCFELDGCRESLASDLVIQDLSEGSTPKCSTDHPGFNPVCLQKWSLRLAADKYRRKNKESYKRTGSEERFLRSIAYREFTRLVYGFLGRKRYPLPACAYTAIRKTFKSKDEEYGGFVMDDTME